MAWTDEQKFLAKGGGDVLGKCINMHRNVEVQETVPAPSIFVVTMSSFALTYLGGTFITFEKNAANPFGCSAFSAAVTFLHATFGFDLH